MKKMIFLVPLCLLLTGCSLGPKIAIRLTQPGPLEGALSTALEQAGYRPVADGGRLVLTDSSSGEGILCVLYETLAPSPALLPVAWDLNGDGKLACVLVGGEDGAFPEVLTCGPERADAMQSCADLLAQRGKDIEVLVCTDPQRTLGVMDAVQDNGRTVGLDIYIVGMGSDRQLPLLVRSGDLSGVLYPDPQAVAAQAVAQVDAAINSRPLPAPQPVPLTLVSGEAIEDYL